MASLRMFVLRFLGLASIFVCLACLGGEALFGLEQGGYLLYEAAGGGKTR